jgi:RNA polymerase sigma-32 factor
VLWQSRDGLVELFPERVRQIEVRAFEKVQKAVRKGARDLEKPRAEIEAAGA